MVSFKKLRQMVIVQGSGNIVSKTSLVSSFLRLHLSARGEILLIPSDEEKVVIESDDNLIEYTGVMNSGRTLYITNESTMRSPRYTEQRIHIYIRQLDTLQISSDLATVRCTDVLRLSSPLKVKVQGHGDTYLNVDVPSLNVLNQCHGLLHLSGRAGSVEIKNQSHGNLDARELVAGDLKLKNMAHGNVDVHATGNISIVHMGHGHVHYLGDAVLKEMKQMGNGEVRRVVGE